MMKSYLFDLGNSSTGPIGCCIRVQAETPEQALRMIREQLPTEGEIDTASCEHPIEYCHFYVNADNITLADIHEEDDA